MNSRTFDMAAHEDRLDRVISTSYATSFMSNSKWRRFFLAMTDARPDVGRILWKFVGRETAVPGAAPDGDCLGDRYVTRTSFAAFPYKEIEWIEFPELSELPAAVVASGKFETSTSSSGIRVYGYR